MMRRLPMARATSAWAWDRVVDLCAPVWLRSVLEQDPRAADLVREDARVAEIGDGRPT